MSNLPARLAAHMEEAKVLAASDLLPPAFRNKPANVLLAREIGNSLGLSGITAITNLVIIDGKPTLSAQLQAALCRKAGHKVRVEVADDQQSATCVVIRSDDPDYEHTVTWTAEKAQQAGLWGKGAWSKYPGQMLANRAITECIRRAASDVLLGVAYTAEELGGEADVDDPTAPTPANPIIDVTPAEEPFIDVDIEEAEVITDDE